MIPQIVFMYSGQGSQYYHMGRELYEKNLYFKKWMLKLDDIAYNINGKSIVNHIYNDTIKKSDPLNQITYSHPAIFMIEFSLTQLLIENGILPDSLFGASLGEYVCAAVANIVSFENIFEAIIRQTEMIEDSCPEGAMMAILHDVNLYYKESYISERSELAGINFPTNFVISGLKKDLFDIEIYLKKRDILFQVLPVSYGFHSNNINPIKNKYGDFLEKIKLRKADIPVFSCSQVKKFTDVIPDYLWEVIHKPIMFQQMIHSIEDIDSCIFLDLSPSGTLSTFIKYNFTDLKVQSSSILNPYGNNVKQLDLVLNSFKNKTLIK